MLKKQAKLRKNITLFRLVLLVLAGIIACTLLFTNKATAPQDTVSLEPSSSVEYVEGRYLVNGTVSWARRYNEWSKRADGTTDYGYPFSGLSSFERSKYDAWIADLACVVTDQDVPIGIAESRLLFNCPNGYLEEAKKFFDVFSLSSDRISDFGSSAVSETKRNLQLQGFGSVEANTCGSIVLPANKIKDEAHSQSNIPFLFCVQRTYQDTSRVISQLQTYAFRLPTIVVVRTDNSYAPKADENQIKTAHDMVDAGADIVVVNGGHWVQNGEVYKGKPILYSLGNFIFDEQVDTEVTRSVSLDVTLRIVYQKDTEALLSFAESCQKDADKCFDLLQKTSFDKPSLILKYDIVAGDGSNKLQKLADQALRESVQERVGWSSMQAIMKEQQ